MVYLLFSGIMSVLSFGAVLTFTGGLGFVIGNDEGFEGGVAIGTFISYFHRVRNYCFLERGYNC